MHMRQQEDESSETKTLVRLSVVLDEQLSEHVRFRAYQTRKSRSAFVRQLVQDDLQRQASAEREAVDE